MATRILLGCLYFVSLPTAYLLAIYFEIGVTGLWTGFSMGQITMIILYMLIVLKVDWQEVIERNRQD